MNREQNDCAIDSLSQRESDILNLLVDGCSDAEIARTLILQVSTIKWYNRQIFNKLNVSNRREAVLLVRQRRQQAEHSPRAVYYLPAPPTPLVGRDRETAAVGRLLKEARLVTILAPGGMGKTRLSLAVAEQAAGAFADGVCFVSLAALPPDGMLALAVSSVLGLPYLREGSPDTPVFNFLRDKSLLLVLDNFEHLLGQALLVSQMLEAAPRLKILVTSRERLRLHGEAVYSLGGLTYPDRFQTDTRYGALDLFAQCARHILPDFQLDMEHGPDVVRLCQLTGGMPLALELAATWLEALPLADIVEAIARNRALFTSPLRDMPERHASISAVLVGSWEQISAVERQAYMVLTVFRGGCSRRAARMVTGAAPETLAALVGKALMRLNGAGRYSFHELMRQYGEEQLAAAGQVTSARSAHSAYYLRFLCERESDLKGCRQAAALDEIDADFENIRAAWRWAVECGDVAGLNAALEGLYWFCEFRNRIQDRDDLLRHAANTFAGQHGEGEHLYGRLLARSWSAGGLSALPVRTQMAARHQLKEALVIARHGADCHEVAVVQYQRGLAAAASEHDASAVVFFAHAYSDFVRLGDHFYAAQSLLWRAFSEVDLIRFADAEDHARTSVALLRQTGEEVGLARALLTLGATVENKPDYLEAERCYEDAYQLLHRMNARVDAANVGGWYLAGAALRNGHFDRHRILGEELLAVAEEHNIAALKARALSTLCLAAFIEGNYETARLRGEESITLFGEYPGGIIAPVFLSYALVMLGETDQARLLVLPALKSIADTNFLVFDFVTLPLVAVLLAAGRFQESAAAMGLSLNHPASLHAWATLVFERTHLRSRLESELGSSEFETALRRGNGFAPHDIFNWLLAMEPEKMPT